ncbi:4-(cytidine 5'-diphospho)-2-C-methyl-D-erythritol kinase [bacterium]|nr:MAG: 4-(cytidine 5'-diphospho)-2-C-methyl-D-erythritol kinase [bacterium]
MKTIEARTPAKVNLHLEVLYQREDGYHEIETIFQAIGIYDCLQLRRTKGPIHITCEHPDVPEDRTNLCHRAAKLLRARTGVDYGVDIHIDKQIPVAAGLGGGSSDAAATLLALRKLWQLDLDDEHLHEMAAILGADVPFFLKGGTQLGRGIGDELSPLPAVQSGHFLVVSPPVQIRAAWAYAQLRMGLTQETAKITLRHIKPVLSRFPERQWPGFNRLGDVVFPAHPLVHRLYLDLLDTDPALAMLSGSGSSVYAVYNTEAEVMHARESLDPGPASVWLGGPVSGGVVLRDR